MIVFGLISPHPPLIIPEIGGDDVKQVRRTIEALDQAVTALAEAKPDELIIISPHEDHGFEVPEYYLQKRLPGTMPIQEILVTEDSYQFYVDYGRDEARRSRRENKRVAIVASGDLSHVLKADGPYGYHEAGTVLDRLIVEAVRHRDIPALLKIEPEVLDKGAECGLRSILFLLGALEGQETEADVLSYEGPFGVGYLVATFIPEIPAKADQVQITELARAAVKHYLLKGEVLSVPKDAPKELHKRAGAFVSLHAPGGELRGCIGTILPTKPNLALEVIANAISAATVDDRFEPVRLAEVDDLKVSVDVLSPPHLEPDQSKLDPKRFGVIVTARNGRQGVLLPDLEGVDSVADQIRICREKGGIGPGEAVEIRKFEAKRYA